MNKKIEFLMERVGKSKHFFEKMSEQEADKLYEKEMEKTMWDTVDTMHLQVVSVVKFMHHIGYEPEYQTGKLVRFVRTRNEFKRYGGADDVVSVRMAISLHNGINVGDIVMCSGDPIGNLNRYLSRLPIKISAYDYGVAKASRLVRKAKLQFSRKKGIIVQSHKVRFASVYAKATYGHWVEDQQ